jgi:membrane protease YdiL (CAAX protease family)
MSIIRRHPAAAFVILTYLLSASFYVRIASDGKLKALPILGLMWCPGMAAMILRLLLQGNLRGTGWSWRAPKWQVLSYLLPPVLGLAVYGTVWITGIGAFNPGGIELGKQSGVHVSMPVTLLLLSTLGLLQGMVFALGEEIGWRGFLVPELAKFSSFPRTAWLSGAAWAAYHYPLILFAEYHSGTPKWFALPVFTWMVLAMAFVFAWVRLKSGSVWTAVILHASHNLFVQQIFDPLTTDRGVTKYVTTEFGIGLALAYTLVALYFWSRRDEVGGNEPISPQ